MLHQQ